MPNLNPKHKISLFFSISANLELGGIICVLAAEGRGDADHVEGGDEFVIECNSKY